MTLIFVFFVVEPVGGVTKDTTRHDRNEEQTSSRAGHGPLLHRAFPTQKPTPVARSSNERHLLVHYVGSGHVFE